MSFGITPPHVSGAAKPMQVRFFQERSLDALERTINAWLAQNPQREIVEIRQSVVAEGMTRGDREFIVSLWYIER
jgi:hypothetical protein